jgi:hypothetical protein
LSLRDHQHSGPGSTEPVAVLGISVAHVGGCPWHPCPRRPRLSGITGPRVGSFRQRRTVSLEVPTLRSAGQPERMRRRG